MNIINYLNIAIVAVMLIPNIFYAVKFRGNKNLCTNKAMKIVEFVGRILCILFMAYPVGQREFGFPSAENFIIYVFGNGILVAMYIVVWISYFKKQSVPKATVLSIVPPVIFALCGLMLEHWLLVFAAVLFAVGHLYVTAANGVKKISKKEQKTETTEEQKSE